MKIKYHWQLATSFLVIIFIFIYCLTHSLTLKQRLRTIRKWPITHPLLKYVTLMGRHLSPQYGHVIRVSGYPVLEAVN